VARQRNQMRSEEGNLINSLLRRDQKGVICGARDEIRIELKRVDLTSINIIYLSKAPKTAQQTNERTISVKLSHSRKLIVTDLHKKSPALYEIQRFVTAFTKAHIRFRKSPIHIVAFYFARITHSLMELSPS
jgi:hypothetical protein